MFEEQVEKTPDNIAISFGDRNITYKELNQKSNQVARLLQEKGILRNSIVAIVLERSPEMIIGALGVLKAGVHTCLLIPHILKRESGILWKILKQRLC
nr:AMP-binding protein [Ruminiclostridium josui]